MKRISWVTLFIALIGVLFPALVHAEAPITPGGCASKNIAIRPIEQQQVTTVQGRVARIEYGKQQQIAAKNMVMWLRLKTANGEEVPVYLGSTWHLHQQHLRVRVGDLLEIQGVKTPGANLQSAMTIANTIKKGDRVWKVSIPNKPNVAKSCQQI